MTLDIVVRGTAAAEDGHGGHSSDGTGPDLDADFSPDWRPRPAGLAPAPEGRTHKLELRATRTTAEVAPGVEQETWTFGTVFDTVYKEGAYLLTPEHPGGAQVLDLAPAQGGFVETTFPGAGHYSFVDHDMRHAGAGAHGTVEVNR